MRSVMVYFAALFLGFLGLVAAGRSGAGGDAGRLAAIEGRLDRLARSDSALADDIHAAHRRITDAGRRMSEMISASAAGEAARRRREVDEQARLRARDVARLSAEIGALAGEARGRVGRLAAADAAIVARLDRLERAVGRLEDRPAPGPVVIERAVWVPMPAPPPVFFYPAAPRWCRR